MNNLVLVFIIFSCFYHHRHHHRRRRCRVVIALLCCNRKFIPIKPITNDSREEKCTTSSSNTKYKFVDELIVGSIRNSMDDGFHFFLHYHGVSHYGYAYNHHSPTRSDGVHNTIP